MGVLAVVEGDTAALVVIAAPGVHFVGVVWALVSDVSDVARRRKSALFRWERSGIGSCMSPGRLSFRLGFMLDI